MTPGTQIGSYIIEKLLGDGGMAQVYLATHVDLGSKHAIKVLLPELLRDEDLRLRFIGEGRIQAQLRHPNIVPVTDVVSVPGVAGLVMDFVDGVTLDEFIQQNPQAEVETVREIFLQILDAIDFAHENGVVHRDIKPSNVLISKKRDGSLLAQVLDFGIAKVFEAEGRAATRTGMRMGTPQYMSPEQVRGAKDVDHRSDIFSLGTLLYEMASGGAAFDGESEFDIQTAIVQGNHRSVDTLSSEKKAAFADVIERALKVERAERFQSCSEFIQAVGGVGSRGQRVPATVLSAGEERGQAVAGAGAKAAKGNSQALFWAAGGVLALVVVSWSLWGGGTPEGMIRIPAGSFQMGSLDGDDNELPITQVSLSRYFIDRTPVTVAAYRKCVDADSCSKPATVSDHKWCNWGQSDKDAHPINCVDWFQAKAFCEWRGARLPTEAEWEYAAKGRDGRKYPWGNEEPANRACWDGKGNDLGEGERYGTCPVGNYPSGASPFGVLDMAGNVWEWVGDWYKDSLPGANVKDPTGPSSGESRVLRGGSWSDFNTVWLRAGFRSWDRAVIRSYYFGFRCARGAVFD